MSPLILETTLHWAAVGTYILALVMFAYVVIFDKPKRASIALVLLFLGLIPHSVALAVRWAEVGHGPYMLKYEVLSSNAWITTVLLLGFVWRKPRWALLGLVALPAVILMMGFGLFSNPEARDLPPTLKSVWLIFHVFFNKLAVGAFILSAGSAFILLRKLKGRTGKFLEKLPGADVLEAYTIRFVGFGLIFWTVTIVAGAIWADQSWGRYWGWDPIESWALVTWLCYGVLLHLRLFFKLSAARTAIGTLLCFVVSVLTVFIFPFMIPSLHSAYFQ